MPQESRDQTVFTVKMKSPLLDAMNCRILGELQRDPRLGMSELARRVGMSSPAVTERVRQMEEAGVIKGWRLDVDPAALGLPLAAYVRIRPNPGQLPKIVELARRVPYVEECHRVTGEDCFVLKVHLPAVDQLDGLLDMFLAYGSTTTSIIQSSPVEPRPLPIPGSSPSTAQPPTSRTSRT